MNATSRCFAKLRRLTPLVRKLKPTLKYLFAVLFIAAGSNHFFSASFYIRIMPPRGQARFIASLFQIAA